LLVSCFVGYVVLVCFSVACALLANKGGSSFRWSMPTTRAGDVLVNVRWWVPRETISNGSVGIFEKPTLVIRQVFRSTGNEHEIVAFEKGSKLRNDYYLIYGIRDQKLLLSDPWYESSGIRDQRRLFSDP
jgi:hypothetical protein